MDREERRFPLRPLFPVIRFLLAALAWCSPTDGVEEEVALKVEEVEVGARENVSQEAMKAVGGGVTWAV